MELGGEVHPFRELVGIDGKSYSLSSFNDKQILIIIFAGNGCPTVKATEERIMAIQRDYGQRGVQILMVNSNNSSISPPDTIKEMTERARERSYNFPYVKDNERGLAMSLGATNTPHVFVFDAGRKLRYKGRVDNARQASRVTVNDLRNALDDLLAGKEPQTSQTTPFGCSIIW
jgi:thiol-disulfide isomerase/thioredoxin